MKPLAQSPLPTATEALQALRERFDAKWVPEPNTGCWLWASTMFYDYGAFSVNRQNRRAHRVAWELYRGLIPEGTLIDHVCRVKSCVNPDHLRLATFRQNSVENNDGPSAINAKKTHCPLGHVLEGGNLVPRSDGARACYKCLRRRSLKCAADKKRRLAGLPLDTPRYEMWFFSKYGRLPDRAENAGIARRRLTHTREDVS